MKCLLNLKLIGKVHAAFLVLLALEICLTLGVVGIRAIHIKNGQ